MESAEQPPSRMSLIECRNGIETLTDIEFNSLSGKWVREETMAASQKAKEYLDTYDAEIAYQTEKGYFSIQTVSDGYDYYTIYGKDFHEIDGGVYDNPDISIGEAMEEILSDEGIPMTACKVMDYEELQEKAETSAQEESQKAQTEEKEKMPLISDMTEPETALNGQSRAGIEETVLCYAQAQIDEMGLSEEVELLGARVYGSRSREGMYHEGSDIDVVISYSGDLKEDVFFNALHEGDFKIAGIPVDINLISAEQTGTLEEYLERAGKYLDEKQNRMEILENPGQTEQEAFIAFYVAECTEFPVLGEYHERLETLQEALELYEKIPAERRNGLKGIGFRLEDGSIYDGNFDLMVMGEMQTEFINEIPQIPGQPISTEGGCGYGGDSFGTEAGAGSIGSSRERRMMVRFEENEYFLMAMLQKESRQATIEEIHNVIPYIDRDEEGKIIVEHTYQGFDQTAIQQIRDYLNPPQPAAEPAQQKQDMPNGNKQMQTGKTMDKPPLENWQKYMENGEYLRSSEIEEEQNYNMIDGRRNNMSHKGKDGRGSVLIKLRRKQAEIAKRSGKPVPQMAMAEDMERRRK